MWTYDAMSDLSDKRGVVMTKYEIDLLIAIHLYMAGYWSDEDICTYLMRLVAFGRNKGDLDSYAVDSLYDQLKTAMMVHEMVTA